MLKQLLNECRVELLIHTPGPLLVKSGLDRLVGPKMTFVRVPRNGRDEVYLPGSSLKGVFRAQAERIARTLLPPECQERCCDPLGPRSCSARLVRGDGRPDGPAAYHGSCLICRLFGSTALAGRLAFQDAYLVGDQPVEPHLREGVGINRVTGGSFGSALFDLEALGEATFQTSLHLRNFELWQLGLLGFLLADLADGYLRIGYGKSRGFGAVRGELEAVEVHYLGPARPPNGALRGLAAMLPDATDDYAFSRRETADLRLQAADGGAVDLAPDRLGLRWTYRFAPEQADALWRSVAPLWLAEAAAPASAAR